MDPRLRLNCPRCGVPLVYVLTTTEGQNTDHVYICDQHGEYRLALADGRLRGGSGPYGRSEVTRQ